MALLTMPFFIYNRKKYLIKVKVSDKIAKSSNDRKQQKKRGKTTDCSKTQGSRRG